MKVYIASSWRNAHGVELLTEQLRSIGCDVASWIENNYGENHNHVTKRMDFEQWVASGDSLDSFWFDTAHAQTCDLFIWYGPAGMDAAAELGMAYSAGQGYFPKLIWGLWAKGENLGLMRRAVARWFSRPGDLVAAVRELSELKNCNHGY